MHSIRKDQTPLIILLRVLNCTYRVEPVTCMNYLLTPMLGYCSGRKVERSRYEYDAILDLTLALTKFSFKTYNNVWFERRPKHFIRGSSIVNLLRDT